MVKNLYAVPASRTVACSFWPKDLACTTQTRGSCGIAGNFRYSSGKVQEMCVIFSTQLEKGAFGDDPGICAGGEIEEEIHQCHADEKEDGQCGVYFPVNSYHEDAEGYSDAQGAAIDVEHSWGLLCGSSDAAAAEEAVVRGVYLVNFGHDDNYLIIVVHFIELSCNASVMVQSYQWYIIAMQGRKYKVRSYFQITQDPPQVLPTLRKTNKSFNNYKLPTKNGFFFIDFTEGCQLRLLKKRKETDFGQPLELQRFGKNVIINVEDASQPQGQLVKYEQQHMAIRQKKVSIERKLKSRLDKGFKLRSKSHFAIKNQLIGQYTSPIKVTRKQSIQTSLPAIDQKSPRKIDLALKKLGLLQDWQVL